MDQPTSRLSLRVTDGVTVLESASADKRDFYDLGIEKECDNLGAGKTRGRFVDALPELTVLSKGGGLQTGVISFFL